jgi:adenine specific DNA methylase Mod
MTTKKLIKKLAKKQALKSNKNRKKSIQKFWKSNEGKETHERFVRFNHERGTNVRSSVAPKTKMRNFRMTQEASDRLNEIAKKLDCTYSHVLHTIITNYEI